LFFAFVDLKLGKEEVPDVFIVPSNVVAAYFAPRMGKLTRYRWHPGIGQIVTYRNNWTPLEQRLFDNIES